MEAFGLVFLYSFTAFDDLRTKQVRLMEIIIFGVIGILINVFSPSQSLPSIVGGVAVGLILVLISYLSKEKVGMGDALIVTVSGLYLGFVNTIVLLWLSSLLTAVYCIFRKKKEAPFVPFLTFAYVIMLMVHHLGGVFI